MYYKFIAAGTYIGNTIDNKLYLDVGNNLKLGIIDHHQLENVEKSATRLVYENSDFIDKNIDTIVLHDFPDLDCVASSFLVESFLTHNKFPEFSEELCIFLDKVDFGYKTNNLISLASLFSILKSSCKNDDDILKMGFKLIETLSAYGFDNINIPKHIYIQEQENIINDKEVFEKDLEEAVTKKFTVQDKKLHLPIEVDGLILIQPKSSLFKDWARAQGNDLLIVKWRSKRVVISVKGDGFLSLYGIGDKLNVLEAEKRKELNIQLDEPNRAGYNIADPWYDGRAHGYTIIDTPRRGTLLELEDILSVM